MINNNNIATIKKLCDKIEYTVTKTEKEARISPIYEQFAYDIYKEDLTEMLKTIEKDVIAIYNRNTRDYSNMFTEKRNNHYYNDIDIKRLGLTKTELQLIDNVYLDEDGSIIIETSKDITDKKYLLLKIKIENNLIRESVSATGCSQSDWEQYFIISYKNIDTTPTSSYSNLVDNLKYMFTVQEYYINLVDIETRLYTSGIEEIEEVEGDSYSTTTYTGYIDKEELKELEKQGYTIINNN